MFRDQFQLAFHKRKEIEDRKCVARVSDTGSHPKFWIAEAGESGKRNSPFLPKRVEMEQHSLLAIQRTSNLRMVCLKRTGGPAWTREHQTFLSRKKRAGVVTRRGGDFFFFGGGGSKVLHMRERQFESKLTFEWVNVRISENFNCDSQLITMADILTH